MTNHENKLIGAYDVQAEVLNKITELKSQGYSEDDIYVVAQNHDQVAMVERQTHVHVDADSTEANGTPQQEEGFMGKFINLLAGEEASGDAFNSLKLNEKDAEQSRRQLEEGKLLVYVDSDYNESYNSFHEKRGTSSSREGFAAGNTNDGLTAGNTNGVSSASEEEKLRLHEERLHVDKERVQTGEVNVGKHVVENEQTIEVPVEREEVYVERRPVNDSTASTDTNHSFDSKDAYTEGDTIRVPLTEERVEVTKTDVVAEEIVIGKRKVQDTEHVKETVRKEVADIDEDVEDKDRNRF
ncbi:uncharacterized protein (TIGR02271 family) [Planomicrobium koreense]|jgi:uncharacterized protein (TIGR02271 family)|uniref:Uncharacterized protein (TIGR02271 family) n=1 Tax=Planococcus koreensis TaxID=112331 RepID=A0A7W8CR90_9BACL|nr:MULTISPECIES: DUF2382 domain-containing protein [Planococcus]MBB5180195.1 uncharacterized protein (TIGR02271 family) [Planococcus koreensis]MDN3449988.1 DUF2382 domain-containing protein [Planococcus sp. APC 3906]